ncbi:MAG: hypothetical protein EOO75_10890 [Myxococcales bacterium]|nr:MAG: hypothetical protein EOO75_10890 [Myxococcales bacterium]
MAAPGTDGCRFRMLGHPHLLVMGDGSMLGLGGLCEKGDDSLGLAQVDALEPPFARLPFNARLAVERFTAQGSSVEELPVAGRTGILRGAQLVAIDDRQALAAVVTEVPRSRGDRASAERLGVARFDGQRWSDVTPPEFPYSAMLLKPDAGAPVLLSPGRSARLTPDGWQSIAMPDCLRMVDPDASLHPLRVTPDGAVLMVSGGCLGRLGAGATQVQAVALPGGVVIEDIALRDGDTYVAIEQKGDHQLLRLAR